MGTTPNPLLALLAALLLSCAFGPGAAAFNNIEGFTKKPTFTAPAGCKERAQIYGVMASCETEIAPGRFFVASIDTAVGWFKSDAAENSKVFVEDHVAEIRAYWKQAKLRSPLVFSSRPSTLVPGNAPPGGTHCFEYSIGLEFEKTADDRPGPVVWRIEGLTCAWQVEHPAAGKWNIELFWLEAYDEYVPSLGQTPMPSFDALVRDLFASARL